MIMAEIHGRAKNPQYKYGEWLRTDTVPCGKVCNERSEGCHSRCKRYKKWKFLHGMAMEEHREESKKRNEVFEEHVQAMEKFQRRKRRKVK